MRQPAIDAARAGGATVIGELELASRWLAGRDHGDHRDQACTDDDTLTGRMLSRGSEGHWWAEHRQCPERAGRSIDPTRFT